MPASPQRLVLGAEAPRVKDLYDRVPRTYRNRLQPLVPILEIQLRSALLTCSTQGASNGILQANAKQQVAEPRQRHGLVGKVRTFQNRVVRPPGATHCETVAGDDQVSAGVHEIAEHSPLGMQARWDCEGSSSRCFPTVRSTV